jgi:hypothetical protein
MTHNLLLIWLNKNIDDNSVDRQNSITQLTRELPQVLKSFWAQISSRSRGRID